MMVLLFGQRFTTNPRDYLSEGFTLEDHHVKTRDGHILIVHRIVRTRNYADHNASPSPPCAPSTPIIFQHGLMHSAGVWLANGPRSYPMYLATLGCDVWLGNTRGVYRLHESIKPSNRQYWDWTLTDLGTYDFEAIVLYVEKCTAKKPVFVGHSQGGTQALIGFQVHSDLSQHLSLFVGVCPAYYLRGSIHWIFRLANRFPSVTRLIFGSHGFAPITVWLRYIFPQRLYAAIGVLGVYHIFHWRNTQWPKENMPAFFKFTPEHTSARLVVDWLFSLHKRKIFPSLPSTVPEFSIKNIHCPVAIFAAQEDSVVDCDPLKAELAATSCNVVHWCDLEHYNHMDVLWAADSIDRIGVPLLRLVQTLDSGSH
ncbi:abhydrolase associated lipase [Pelomyxa schiedti]|nr:abhydrolase associated lipase [Pelomyxa schiedti]